MIDRDPEELIAEICFDLGDREGFRQVTLSRELSRLERQVEEARTLFVTHRSEQALEVIESLSLQLPGHSLEWWKAECLLRLERLEECLDYCEERLQNPESPPSLRRRAQYFFVMARAHREADRHSLYRDYMQKVYDTEKERGEQTDLSVWACHALERFDEMLTVARGCLEEKPGPYGHYLLALSLRELGRLDEASEAIATSLSYDPREKLYLNFQESLQEPVEEPAEPATRGVPKAFLLCSGLLMALALLMIWRRKPGN